MSEAMSLQKRKALRLKGKPLEKLLNQVYERANGICEKCRKRAGVEFHHIIFRSQGGSDTMENLIFLCKKCHGKEHHLNIIEGE